MKISKRIFVIGDFRDGSARSIQIQSRMYVKGFIRLGCDVQRFSYSDALIKTNPFRSRHVIPRFVKRKTDASLVNLVKCYQPDVIFVLSMKYLDAETIRAVREAAGRAVIAGRDEDPFPEENPHRLAIAKETDLVLTTSGGRFLKTYKDAGVPRCAFVPNACDPDIQQPYDVGDDWRSDIIFTGKVEHCRLGDKLGRDPDRYDLLHRLSKMPNARLYGCCGSPKIEGMRLFYAISGAKTALSINIVNDVRLYHSDRLINYLSCGTFVLAKRVPDTDLLFKDGVHLRYFDAVEEFFELADWYLKHDQEREKMAARGMEYAHKEFNCTRVAGIILDLLETGDYNAPWKVVL